MTNQEAIVRIENHIRIHGSKEGFRACHIQEALNMAVDALKTQEPVEPILEVDTWECGNCNHKLENQELLGDNVLFHEQYSYCPECGKAVKWND